MQYHLLTWPEVDELRKNNKTLLILPLGTVEQHGYHLPLGTDTIILESVLQIAIEKSKQNRYILVLPILPYGFSHHHVAFPGTLSLSAGLLENVLLTLGQQLLSQGFRKLLLISWHGGHTSIMHDVSYELKKAFYDKHIFYISIIDFAFNKIKELISEPVYHADDLETSIMLALGQRVLMDKAIKDGIAEVLDEYTYLDFKKSSRVKIPVNIAEFSKSGVIGDPTSSSIEKGKLLVEIITDELAKILDKIVKI
ncbi:MAG: creatininase family protein [Candidatus Aenigmarchaeota archaeon]|nr:creatininase family protein [Candidatus Aenigmarchaeota archaeon]